MKPQLALVLLIGFLMLVFSAIIYVFQDSFFPQFPENETTVEPVKPHFEPFGEP